MNFVGPNLDSYYIAYHNRIDDNRFLNISHLLFSKNGQMVVNGLKYENMFERPTFEKFIDKENYLSEEEITSEKSTIEFNFIGEDAKMIFSYLNENLKNYFLANNNIYFTYDKLLVSSFANLTFLLKNENEVISLIDELTFSENNINYLTFDGDFVYGGISKLLSENNIFFDIYENIDILYAGARGLSAMHYVFLLRVRQKQPTIS